MTFQENCKYSLHIKAKLLKANKCLYVIRTLRNEGARQEEVNKLFNSLIGFTYSYLWFVRIWCVRFGLDRCTNVSRLMF